MTSEEDPMAEVQRAEIALESLYHWHTVLIVDDDPQILSSLRRLLDREPYEVVTTDRPALALEWIASKEVSLVISDQKMPEMAGDLFLEGVWQCSPGTRRVLLTAYPESVGGIPVARRQKVKILSKPWNDAILKKTIRDLLRYREGSME